MHDRQLRSLGSLGKRFENRREVRMRARRREQIRFDAERVERRARVELGGRRRRFRERGVYGCEPPADRGGGLRNDVAARELRFPQLVTVWRQILHRERGKRRIRRQNRRHEIGVEAWPTCVSHRTSARFRETSARHSAATRRRPSACFTQNSEASHAHQPDVGRHAARERLELRNVAWRDTARLARENRVSASHRAPQKSNLSMLSFVKSSGGPRMTSLPRIAIFPSRPASIDAAPGASLFCAMSAPAYTVR